MPVSSSSAKSAPKPIVVVPTPDSACVLRHLDQRRLIGEAHVREAVAQEQDLARAFILASLERFDALHPARREVRLAMCLDAGDPLQQRLAHLADRRRRSQELDHVVVGHQGQLVGGSEAARQEGRAVLRRLDLVPLHRPGPVDHERQVQRRARPVGLCLGRDQLEHGVDVVLGLDRQELVLQSDVRLHAARSPFSLFFHTLSVRLVTDTNDRRVIGLLS
jgi:hypothetical protein